MQEDGGQEDIHRGQGEEGKHSNSHAETRPREGGEVERRHGRKGVRTQPKLDDGAENHPCCQDASVEKHKHGGVGKLT